MTSKTDKPFWWYWIWVIHLLFIGVMYFNLFTSISPDWLKTSYSAVSLSHERNYAVWWSGICLFIGAQLFYRIGSHHTSAQQAWKWYVLSLALLALAIDEIGSLHEVVADIGGWLGLLPFALVFFLAFSSALLPLFREKQTRTTAILITFAISFFVGVAGLEFIEHNIRMESGKIQRWRLLGEEGTELFAMALLILAGLTAVKTMNIGKQTLSSLFGDIKKLTFHRDVVFLLFTIQIVSVVIFVVPNPGLYSEGNPASVFPILLFFTLSMICFHYSRTANDKGLWWLMGLVFFLTSLAQIHSFNEFLNKLLQSAYQWGAKPPVVWTATFVPLSLVILIFLVRNFQLWRTLIPISLLMVCTTILFYQDYYSEVAYYLFSSTVGYISYWLVTRHISISDD